LEQHALTQAPLDDVVLEAHMIALILAEMDKAECPQEQYVA
jgi:hypothetical protein